MGIKYVDGKLYVSEKHGLTELVDTNGDEVTDQLPDGRDLAVRRRTSTSSRSACSTRTGSST